MANPGWLIVGLGNPGPEYAFTRHNIGFLAVDLLAEGLAVRSWSNQEKAQVAKVKWQDCDVWLVKPQTFMNRSGESVQPLMAYYKATELLVIHDEVEFAFGKMKLQKNRSHGGHNGVRSISGAPGKRRLLSFAAGHRPARSPAGRSQPPCSWPV